VQSKSLINQWKKNDLFWVKSSTLIRFNLSIGSVGTGRVSTGMLHLSGEGSQVGFSEVRGDMVDEVYLGVLGVSSWVWDGPASNSTSISSNTW